MEWERVKFWNKWCRNFVCTSNYYITNNLPLPQYKYKTNANIYLTFYSAAFILKSLNSNSASLLQKKTAFKQYTPICRGANVMTIWVECPGCRQPRAGWQPKWAMWRNWKVMGISVDRFVNFSVTLLLDPTPHSPNLTAFGSWVSRCWIGMSNCTSTGSATPVRPTSCDVVSSVEQK